MTVKEDEANVANIFGRIERAAWPELLAGLDERGYAVIPGLLSQRECRGVAALYEDETAFRSRVVMARHNFGRGEYKYLRYPLPPLVAERPRMQSKGEVVPLNQGDAVLFAVNYRPVEGTRGDYRVVMRHGVSRLRSGHRFTLGIIFHDAA